MRCAKNFLGAWRPSRRCGYCNAIAVDIFHSTEFPRGSPRLFLLLSTQGRGPRGRAQARKHGILLFPGDRRADRVVGSPVDGRSVVGPVATPLSLLRKYHKISMACKDTNGCVKPYSLVRADAESWTGEYQLAY